MKVIFLDFDGVITTLKSKWRLDDEKIPLVKEICDKTGAKIVISSSWRRKDVETTLKYAFGKDYDDSHYLLNSKMVVGITDRLGNGFRGNEIQKYLGTHPEIENYVILDDDTDMLDSQRKHFVNTDSYLGISEEDVRMAIQILNKTNKIMEELRNSEGAEETRMEMSLRETFAQCCPFYMSKKCFDEFGMTKEEKICDLGCERGRQFGEKINKILTEN